MKRRGFFAAVASVVVGANFVSTMDAGHKPRAFFTFSMGYSTGGLLRIFNPDGSERAGIMHRYLSVEEWANAIAREVKGEFDLYLRQDMFAQTCKRFPSDSSRLLSALKAQGITPVRVGRFLSHHS